MANRPALHAASYSDQECFALTSQSGVMGRGRESKFAKVQGDRHLPRLYPVESRVSAALWSRDAGDEICYSINLLLFLLMKNHR